MSVYGGDSWAREAHHRKRRVDELMIDSIDSSSFNKLSNGKFICLVCPNRPLFDSSLMISMHGKGARHRAALSKFKERERRKDEEIKKRRLFSGNPTTTAICGSSIQNSRLPSKPLIEQTQKAASEILHSANASNSSICEDSGVKSNIITGHQGVEIHNHEVNFHHIKEADATIGQHLDFRERREKELKFTAAGWKRDCHGKWYRDENVEFDSDEEDPNICL